MTNWLKLFTQSVDTEAVTLHGKNSTDTSSERSKGEEFDLCGLLEIIRN